MQTLAIAVGYISFPLPNPPPTPYLTTMKRNPIIFDKVATEYERYRPGPDEAVIRRVLGLIGDCKSVIEVGAGTGQMTGHLLRAGKQVFAVEPGRAMAAMLRCRWPELTVVESRFEEFEGVDGFQALVSHQAFHWVEAESGVRRAGEVLASGGRLVLIWDVDASQDTPFYRATSGVYERYLPDAQWPSKKPLRAYPELYADMIAHSDLFTDPVIETIPHERTFTKEAWLGLIRTFSDHIELPDEFFIEIGRLVDDFRGMVQRHYNARIVHAIRS